MTRNALSTQSVEHANIATLLMPTNGVVSGGMLLTPLSRSATPQQAQNEFYSRVNSSSLVIAGGHNRFFSQVVSKELHMQLGELVLHNLLFTDALSMEGGKVSG